jgi:hypothetical protein
VGTSWLFSPDSTLTLTPVLEGTKSYVHIGKGDSDPQGSGHDRARAVGENWGSLRQPPAGASSRRSELVARVEGEPRRCPSSTASPGPGGQRRQGVGGLRELDIVGIGYRAEVRGRKITFALGYSHPIVLDIPEGISIAVDKQTHLTVSGIDRQLVGQVAANIRRLRKPDPYKQKGVRYTGEVLKKKVGKTGA